MSFLQHISCFKAYICKSLKSESNPIRNPSIIVKSSKKVNKSFSQIEIINQSFPMFRPLSTKRFLKQKLRVQSAAKAKTTGVHQRRPLTASQELGAANPQLM